MNLFRLIFDTPLVHRLIQTIMVRFERIFTFAISCTSTMAAGRIDTHIHALPPPYIAALEAAGGDISGYPTPDWSLDATIHSMDLVNTEKGMR